MRTMGAFNRVGLKMSFTKTEAMVMTIGAKIHRISNEACKLRLTPINSQVMEKLTKWYEWKVDRNQSGALVN